MIFLRKIKLTWFTMFFIIFTLPKSILLFKLIFFLYILPHDVIDGKICNKYYGEDASGAFIEYKMEYHYNGKKNYINVTSISGQFDEVNKNINDKIPIRVSKLYYRIGMFDKITEIFKPLLVFFLQIILIFLDYKRSNNVKF